MYSSQILSVTQAFQPQFWLSAGHDLANDIARGLAKISCGMLAKKTNSGDWTEGCGCGDLPSSRILGIVLIIDYLLRFIHIKST